MRENTPSRTQFRLADENFVHMNLPSLCVLQTMTEKPPHFWRTNDFADLPLRFTLSATGSPTLLPAAWPYPKAWNPVIDLKDDARPRNSCQ